MYEGWKHASFRDSYALCWKYMRRGRMGKAKKRRSGAGKRTDPVGEDHFHFYPGCVVCPTIILVNYKKFSTGFYLQRVGKRILTEFESPVM